MIFSKEFPDGHIIVSGFPQENHPTSIIILNNQDIYFIDLDKQEHFSICSRTEPTIRPIETGKMQSIIDILNKELSGVDDRTVQLAKSKALYYLRGS